MRTTIRSIAPRRSTRLAFAGLALLAAVQGASAEDRGGVQEFFQSIFGGGQAQPGGAPVYGQPGDTTSGPVSRSRPLTVRLHRAQPRMVVAQRPTKPGEVSIYADRTLRRGDAVMMRDGIRVFAGSASWPYTDDDFVSLADARDMSRTTSKVLAAIDRAPRG